MGYANILKTVAAAGALAMLLAGCGGGYYDRDGYWHGDRYDHHRYDHDGGYNHRDHDSNWSCDRDGDNCRRSD